MKIKFLPLSFPFNLNKDYWEDCVEEEARITPVFNKNGYYLDRETNQTWLEINGEAWTYQNREDFDYEIATHEENNWLDKDVFNALKTLSKAHPRILTKKQSLILYYEECRYSHRKTYRDSRLLSLRKRKCKPKL